MADTDLAHARDGELNAWQVVGVILVMVALIAGGIALLNRTTTSDEEQSAAQLRAAITEQISSFDAGIALVDTGIRDMTIPSPLAPSTTPTVLVADGTVSEGRIAGWYDRTREARYDSYRLVQCAFCATITGANINVRAERLNHYTSDIDPTTLCDN